MRVCPDGSAGRSPAAPAFHWDKNGGLGNRTHQLEFLSDFFKEMCTLVEIREFLPGLAQRNLVGERTICSDSRGLVSILRASGYPPYGASDLVTASTSDSGFTLDLEAARGGDAEAQGRVLESCRDYLRAIAGRGLGADLATKVGASDLVQETLVGAHFDFTQFRGQTREALLAWLRMILQNRLGFVARHYRDTEKRRLGREIPGGDPTAGGLWDSLLSSSSTPGRRVERLESEDALFAALERLPEDYRRVVVWRQYDEIGFEEIGTRLGRSAEAARKVWSRALMRLSAELAPHHET